MGMLDQAPQAAGPGMFPGGIQPVSIIDQARALAAQRGEPVPDQMTPGWAQWYLSTPQIPQASVQPQQGMAPPGAPQMPPPGGMGLPPAGGPMPTYDQRMDQAQQPGMPPMAPQAPAQPQVAPGEPGEAAGADPFFQALLAGAGGMAGGCGGPQPDLLPNTASIVGSPGAGSRRQPTRRAARAAVGPSESDRLNADMLAAILARRNARA